MGLYKRQSISFEYGIAHCTHMMILQLSGYVAQRSFRCTRIGGYPVEMCLPFISGRAARQVCREEVARCEWHSLMATPGPLIPRGAPWASDRSRNKCAAMPASSSREPSKVEISSAKFAALSTAVGSCNIGDLVKAAMLSYVKAVGKTAVKLSDPGSGTSV